ncbi:hypothetical protein B4U80_05175, partial [Leptotrombidium deliense]
MCTDLEIPIPPCRALCEASRNGCEFLMNKFGMKWPDYLDCNNFPNEEDGTRCIGSSLNITIGKVQYIKPSNSENITFVKLATKNESCAPITIPMCKNVGYKTTKYPSLLNHTSQDEA